MSEAATSINLLSPVILLTAAVISVPLIKRLGLSSVLGYLIAGLIIGPFGLAFFYDSASILHVAELGIVMYLFVIGLGHVLNSIDGHLNGLKMAKFCQTSSNS